MVLKRKSPDRGGDGDEASPHPSNGLRGGGQEILPFDRVEHGLTDHLHKAFNLDRVVTRSRSGTVWRHSVGWD